MTAVASLPMYDLPELRAATDSWWSAIARSMARHGVPDPPERLLRDGSDDAFWRHAGLLITQTCGYPLRYEFADALTAIAVPTYAAEGCGAGTYRSAFIVRADDPATELGAFRDRRAVANSPNSQSGCNALRAAVAPLSRQGRFFADVTWSGAHRRSLSQIASGDADIAAIDAITLALLHRHAPTETRGVRVLGWSAAAPSLPYATRRAVASRDRRRLIDALRDAMADPDAEQARSALLLSDLDPTRDAAYDVIVEMRDRAVAEGYPELG